MKTILITGGAGFLGSAFARYLYINYPDYNIIILDALTYAGDIDNLPVNINNAIDGRLSFHYGDVRNFALVDNLVSQSDIVVHFAAETHVTRSIHDNLLFFETDILGTQSLCTAIFKHRGRIERFIHISSSEVYGTATARKMDELHPLNPMSPYASAKCGADRLVYSYIQTYDIPAIIVRPFNQFGPFQHLEKAIPRFITSCILDESLRVHGVGNAARDFLHVNDTCRALETIMNAELPKVRGEVFNIASGYHRSIYAIAKDILDRMHLPLIKLNTGIEFTGDRPGQVFRHTGDIDKIKNVLGWEPETSWEEGVNHTIQWYKQNEKWWRKKMWMRSVPITTSAGVKEMH